MTGFTRNYANCTKCGSALKLGDTPRTIVYPIVLAIAGLYFWCFAYLRDVISHLSIIVLVVTLILVLPLSFAGAYFVRGVTQNDNSKHL